MTSGFMGLWAAMAILPVSIDGSPLAIACRVTGEERIVPALTSDQICDRLVRQVSDTLKRPVRIANDAGATGPGPSVKIDVQIDARRGAVALVETYRDGKWMKSPELSVTAMDISPNSTTIDQLGRDIADYLSYD